MRQKLLLILTTLLTASTAWAAVGDTFTASNLKYKVTSEEPKTVTLTGYSSTKPKNTLRIPATVNGYAVTAIGNKAFRSCSGLTKVVIPTGVTSIGTSTFSSCDAMKSVTIPNSVTSIGDNAFYMCGELTTVTLPESVTSLGNGAFGYCSGLTSVNIPEGVTSIGENTFFGCSSLTEITIPDGVTSIGSMAFSGCTSLESVNIPNGVTSIGSDAFLGCRALTEIDIPASVTSIGANAFESCSALTTINIYAKSVTCGKEAFKNTSSSLKANVFSEGAFTVGTSGFSGTIAAFTTDDLTVDGISVNQNPGATTDYWATYYHPAANTKINTAGVEIYIATLSSDNAYVNLTKVEGSVIKAGQAVMLKAAATGALSMQLTPDAATGDYTGNDLKGGATVAAGKAAYTLAAKGEKMGFYKFAGSALNPNKAHLELPAGSSAREFISLEDETATGIRDVNDNLNLNGNLNDNGWYTLSGHKLQAAPTQKGIYIHNGRKEAVR